MSTEMIPFASGQLPAYLQNRKALKGINADVTTSAQYPKVSIKGKVFRLVKDNEKKMLTIDVDGDTIPAPSMQLNVLRVNKKARVFFKDSYVEGDSDNTRPTCQSDNGIHPVANAAIKQADKCQLCPHAVWGSKIKDDGTAGEGTACQVVTKLAISAPDQIDQPYLLAVPAGSRKNFDEVVKMADARDFPYNALVLKVSFDPEAPSPKLIFKAVGLLPEESFAKAQAAYDSDMVKLICGIAEERPALPAPAGSVDADELDAAIAARAAVKQAAAPAPAPKPASVAPRVAPAPAPVAPVSMDEIGALVDEVAPPKPAPAPAPKAAAPAKAAPAVAPMDDLMADLDALLQTPDD
jgi:hypothetical protein